MTGFLELVKETMAASGLDKNEFAEKLGMKRTALNHWFKGHIHYMDLPLKRFTALAEMRQQDIGELVAEIQRREEKEGFVAPKFIDLSEDSALADLKLRVIEAPFHFLPDLLEAIAGRMRRIAGPRERGSIEKIMKNCNSISELIRLEIQLKGMNPDSEDGFMEFARCGPFAEDEELARLRGIVSGAIAPSRDDLAGIAFALETFSGRPYSVPDLMRIQHGHHNGLGSQV